ncbi:MAG: 30S ribosomal protein S1 [Candidatus Portnoybacteria bacterium CG_4_10_14_0_2_um_filter_44_20]|uniref:30S ribosomal protein S1 n=3 Tax=Candidatus Portnoyibacteriota TaxID=1817913 RepID=A0A2H0KQ42_9BACT|nr:MAG: 30S ribosomal protein S1 [Candidatus Portnoybacteria bacterium CG11_big_fil_rev_8_21_14_0_20_44_10]PIZ71783.1 MAG: 30S ribosomal protein S1 [Candidatus Portnoybacteria bacterium CG_4_10_14_0_2_um_filter_44_20]PJA63440.1 MAG: 30S ribosomal protein S1 [Candidatus Portnoybacteria bacterium CG_4_9_14_3_um_filter_44_9]
MKKDNQQQPMAKDLLLASINTIKESQILEGKIIEANKSNIFIDFGALGTGIVLGREIKDNPSLVKELKVGQTISCVVLESENENGYIEVSIKEADRELSWTKLEELKNTSRNALAKVIQANRGGLLVSLLDQKGFLPVSQLSPEHYPRVDGGDKEKILKELNKFVGKDLKVKVIDLDPREEKLIVSEKALNKEEVEEIMKYFALDGVFEGTVSAVTDFGAFVRLSPEEGAKAPETEGLIHISELDWQLVRDPREILQEGEKVKVKIVGFYQGRPALSLKALKERPQIKTEKNEEREK